MTTGTTTDRLSEIKARAEKATPGPWRWRGNADIWSLRLSTPHRRGLTVMDFVRWGMAKAAPRFPVDGLMHRADGMVRYEVAPDATDRKDPEVYRGDVIGIRHPDAEFIAASRADVDFLLAEVDRLTAENTDLRRDVQLAEEAQSNAELELHRDRAEATGVSG